MDNANEFLNELCREGKKISIVVEITDTKEAIELLSTMHSKKTCQGVIVQSWGGFNVEGALSRKVEAIYELNRKHQEEMEQLLNFNNLRDFEEDT
ncbi:hypothetical protein NTH42_003103 [Vibrio fluvialis]|nr:hypothetical protein [Vibrio fluvialis]